MSAQRRRQAPEPDWRPVQVCRLEQESPQRRSTLGAVNLDNASSINYQEPPALQCLLHSSECRDLARVIESPDPVFLPFGLERAELTAEAQRLEQAGWLPWEVAARLGVVRHGGVPS